MPDSSAPPWWKSYFSFHYGFLYQGPLAEELATELEVETLARIFSDADGPILDLGCGHGRHLNALRKAKLPVVGMDYSAELLKLVPKKHRKAILRGDMRSLPFASGSLAGVCMLFNTFGYFEDDENQAVLGEVARVLSPVGRLVMDLPARTGMERAIKDVPASMRFQDDVHIYESWFVDKKANRLGSRGTWKIKGEEQAWEMSLRLHTPAEITRMLKRAGFLQVEVRDLEDYEELGTSEPAPEGSDSLWRTATNMAILASRAKPPIPNP